jgi:hypothetical protein
MIIATPIGNITTLNQDEPADIIIGMNTTLEQLDSLRLPKQWQTDLKAPIALGSVLSFQLDRMRQLHMLICHHLGKDGWKDADKYVRIGMDHLWTRHKEQRDFSIVKIGAGRVGTAGGADVNKIRAAMAASFLSVTLVMHEANKPVDISSIKSTQLSKPKVWSPLTGLER